MDKDMIQGKSEKAVGHVKQATGDLTGNEDLQAEGLKDQAKGQLHETVGAAKQLGKDVAASVQHGAHKAEHKI